MKISNLLLSFSLLLVVVPKATADNTAPFLERGSCAASDHVKIFVDPAYDKALASAHRIRVKLFSNAQQTRRVEDLNGHDLNSFPVTALTAPGQNAVDVLKPSDDSDVVLELKYQGFSLWGSGWYLLDIEGPAVYPLRHIRWGSVVTIEWTSHEKCGS